MEIDVSAIVVTFNSAPCIADCLKSILRQGGVQLEVIVVDNASGDQTVDLVRAMKPNVRLLVNRENIGFGRACNQAFGVSRGRFLFLLNPDAWLEEPDSLAQLRDQMQRRARWGLAGTRVIESEGATECPPAACYPDERHVHCDFSHLPGRIAWVFGASMFIRREAFAAVGGFDPGFFLTSEETDLCLRIRQHGWEIGHVPEVTAWHIGAASELGTDPYITWSRRAPGMYRFWSKHYPPKDVRRLLWKDWFRANFRRCWYGPLARLLGPGSSAWHKHRRNAAISDVSWQFLRSDSPPPSAGERSEARALQAMSTSP